MNIGEMINSIRKPHADDVLAPLSTIWGEHPDLPDALSEYPRPRYVRGEHISLNGVWRYAITDTPHEPDTPDGKILVPFSPESRLSGVERPLQPGQYLWYYRTLPALNPPSPGARLFLHFGAVDQIAEVYVNGDYLCTHVGGYLPFTVDITEALRPQNNELTVRVQDTSDTSWHTRGKQTLKRGGMYYTAQSGIWQSVWLEWVPDGYIRALDVISHDDLCTVTVEVETSVPGSVEATLYDDDGVPFTRAYCTTIKEYTGKNPIDLCRSGSDLKPCNKIGTGYTASMRILIEHARPWSPEDPHLYKMGVRFQDDTIETYFAIRRFEVCPDAQGVMRFHLNHKPYFLHGVLDQGYWPESLMTPPSDKALVYDITQMKTTGFNMIRKHIKVECARWYYHCDRIGMIVWQDMVSGGASQSPLLMSYLPTLFHHRFTHLGDGAWMYRLLGRRSKEGRDQWIDEMRGTIAYLKSTPSIGAWVLFNEGWGQFEAAAMTTLARAVDHTRPIDHASGWFDQEAGDFYSVHNYFRKLEVEKDRADRAFVISEYGGFACHIEAHSSVERSYGYRKYATTEELNDAWQTLLRDELAPLIEKGLSGAVYTQVSDIEEETNGVMTYDRKVIKLKPCHFLHSDGGPDRP